MSDQIIQILALFIGLLRFSNAACYYAGGSVATDYTYAPCSTSSTGACCIPGETDACLSNGMCYYPGGNYFYRGACTDPTWSSSGGCPDYCLTQNPTGWLKITRCDNDKFCCQGNDTASCCGDLNKIFTTPSYWVTNSYGQSVQVPGAVASPPSTTSTSSATSSQTASQSAQSNASSGNDSSSGLSTGQLVGAIVAPVCTMLTAIIVAWINRDRIRKVFEGKSGDGTHDAEAGSGAAAAGAGSPSDKKTGMESVTKMDA